MPDDPALRIFPDEFVPNIEGAPYHSKWRSANASGDAPKWAQFRDDVIAGKQVAPPSMSTKYGRALVAAGKEHMSISHFVGTVTNPYPPPDPPPAPPSPGLGVDRATMLGTGGTILREDTATQVDPLPGLWGSTDAQVPSRVEHYTTDGDTRSKANGVAQGNTSYRRLNLLDGDNPGGFGERCDIGRNWWQNGENTGTQTGGTMSLGTEGQRKITFWSMRFPSSFPMSVNAWQQLGQYKQAQPYTNTATRNPDGNGVTIEFQLYGGQFRLFTWWTQRWQTPAPPANQWIRMACDITFSQYTNIGKITFYIDNDADGDFLGADEMFTWNGATNLYVTSAENGLAAGDTLPNVLFLGPYRNSTITGNTYVDIDNVQVYG